jgi:hypothetical protein
MAEAKGLITQIEQARAQDVDITSPYGGVETDVKF